MMRVDVDKKYQKFIGFFNSKLCIIVPRLSKTCIGIGLRFDRINNRHCQR